MKKLIISLFIFIKFLLLVNGEYGTYNNNNNNNNNQFWKSPNYEYEKYTSNLNNNKNFKIPTLESLFHVVSFRDLNNHSSPCTHYGKKRHTLCHKVVSFDQEGYENSLQETRRLILSRLNLDREPHVKINKETLSFIDQLENKILNEPTHQKSSVLKTKYDMKSPQNKIFNSMHEASYLRESCVYTIDFPSTDTLCINFEIPVRNFQSTQTSSILRKPTSIILWIFVRTSTSIDLNEETLNLQIVNRNSKHNSNNNNNNNNNNVVNVKKVVDGWNTIDITSLFKLPSNLNELNKNLNLNFSIIIKCGQDCSIGYTNNEITEQYDDSRSIIVSNSPGKKPLLSINIEELDESLDKSKRTKRRVNNHNNNYNNNNIGGSGGGGNNFKAHGLDREGYQPKYCYNNYPDAEKECCLITYFVNFNSLKWSSWIIYPTGFVANYCSGKCNDIKSFKYASHNAEVKIRINEKLLSKDAFDASEMLETCCHPISMDSLVVKYLAGNGSVVSTVIPNMIITGCGCS